MELYSLNHRTVCSVIRLHRQNVQRHVERPWSSYVPLMGTSTEPVHAGS